MTYKETLRAFKETGLSLVDVLIAEECKVQFTYYNDNDYEIICSLIKDAYLKSEHLEVCMLTWALYDLLEYRTLEEITRKDIINVAIEKYL